MPSFRGDQIALIRFTELDADGATLTGGNQWTTCCDISSVEWENDQEDRESVDVGNANRDCRVRYQRPAILHGKILRVSFVGQVPEAMNMLLDAPLNLNDAADIIGYGSTDYVCKFVSVEIIVKAISGACVTGSQGRAWRIFPKVGQWAITQDESYTDSNEVPMTILEGYAEKNPGYDDPDAIWLESPAKLRPAEDYTSTAVLTTALPECSGDLEDVPV